MSRHGLRVLDAITAGCQTDAAELLFEYLAATAADLGRQPPRAIGDLPPDRQRECRSPWRTYPSPGGLLIAYRDGSALGCVGVTVDRTEHTATIRRLYVRPRHRGNVGRVLMAHAHHRAAECGSSRVLLDVMRTRTAAIALYRRLGYTETDSPTGMMRMQRPLASA